MFYIKKFNLIVFLTVIFAGCAYYNTFFNAQESYRTGMQKYEEAKLKKSVRKNPKYFKKAITKSWKVINQYGDSSKWADDALFLIGKSHFQLEEYKKARDIFEQFLKKYLKSELIPNVQLWLGKTYLKEKKKEKALKIYTDILSSDGNDAIKARAHINLGDLYFESGDYDNAADNYKKCLDLSDDSKLSAKAVYNLAESYFKSQKYDKAIDAYKSVLQSDAPLIRQFTAMKSMVDAYLKKGDMEAATTFLKNSLHDIRFKNYYSLIAAKLANIYEFQGDYDFALENYYDVMREYPRKEGAALAAFYIAQLYEFEYGLFDSAKVNYDRVRKIYSKSEAADEALKRSKLLDQYLKIHNSLVSDIRNLNKLEQGDSSLVDSLVTGKDTVEVAIAQPLSLKDSTNKGTNNSQEAEGETSNFNTDPNGLEESSKNIGLGKNTAKTIKKIKDKKVAITRTPEEVRRSYKKNSYQLAEYFLITYANYDSAEVLFHKFLSTFSDSLLSPKAYYSLYFIYNTVDKDSLKADSIASIITNRYRDTIYGRKLLGLDVKKSDPKEEKIKNIFEDAEKLFSEKKYEQAINLYNNVAKQDSGSIWAIKSLYAAAYISENFLKNNTSAYDYYTQLATLYPTSEQGKIAKIKIKPVPKPVEKQKEKKIIPGTIQKDTKIKGIKNRLLLDKKEKPKKPVIDDK